MAAQLAVLLHSAIQLLQKVFSPWQAHSLVYDAVVRQVQHAVSLSKHQESNNGLRQFRVISAPPDGLCCYHSVLGTLKFDEWSRIARHESGFAVNGRTVKEEADAAHALRKLALESTDRLDDPILVAMASKAAQSLSLDVHELAWLGNTLDLAIRCSVDEKAGGGGLQKNILTAIILSLSNTLSN